MRSCPVCENVQVSLLHRHTPVLFDNHPLAGECVTVVCAHCGFVFNGATHALRSYERYYADLSKYSSSPSSDSYAKKYSLLSDVFMNVFPDRNAAILDVGCGGGGFLAALRERGYASLSGMDPSPACVDAVHSRLGIDCRVGVLSEPPFQSGGFDIVISTGVLEHLLYPAQDLGHFQKLLKPAGAAFVLVPDASRYHEFLSAPFQDFNVEHINHFSPQTLRFLFRNAGWSPISIDELELECTPAWIEPSICGCFRNTGTRSEKDESLKQRILAYIDASSSLLEKIDSRLQDELRDENEIVLWGAGQTTSVLLGQTILKTKTIKAVIDRNPAYRGRFYGAAPVGGPELLADYEGSILVTTIRERDSVISNIREKLGLKNRVITLLP